MKVTRYHNLYQLTIFPRVFPVNCYIYEEEDQLTLIDAGMPSSYKGIVQTVQEINKPLTNIVLTHGHGDHVGALDKLKQAFPNVVVSISERDNSLLKGDTSLRANEAQTPIKGGVPKGIQTEANQLLREGNRVGSLEVFLTQGHTPGSISLLDTKNNAIIAGDAFQTRGRVAVCGQIVRSFPFPAFGTWNKEISLESAKKIWRLRPSLLAVGHGNMIENPSQQMETAIKEAEEKLGVEQKGA
ncbi:MBL fold metallo-hydrolase [Ornithinibacillus californiensis]|uniref:MBL fold metallo-hydrolase n=1 Tax=Ornithinibacillus californiensis TaxID=161536 RepID=UPI00064D7F2A|nr:MBL fold metallo-hydrolase [Ornithinibacillus californiensis]